MHNIDKNVSISTVNFRNGRSARVATVPPEIDTAELLNILSFPVPRAVLILNGGAKNLDPTVSKKLAGLFLKLAKFVIQNNITVITGGTDSGVFALLGQALNAQGGAKAPCIGISITGHHVLNRLEPHHTDFVLVAAPEWGMETKVMYRFVQQFSIGKKSLAIFAGGGTHAFNEMEWNVRQKREMIFVAGSKGCTDMVLEPTTNDPEKKQRLNRIRRKGFISLCDLEKDGDNFVNLVSKKMLE